MTGEYIFVFDEDTKAWWLKVDNADTLIDVLKRTQGRHLGGGLELYWDLHKEANMGKTHTKNIHQILEEMPPKKRFELMTKESRDFNIMLAAVYQAEKYNGTIFDGFRLLNMECGYKELEDIRKYGQTYLNPAGGSTFFVRYKQFCRRETPVFPNFTERDIYIKQFKGGRHYYAYIGNMEVKNGDTLRFDSRDKAYKRALELLGR